MGATTFGSRPVFHFSTDQSPRAEATAAPHRPPISAWLELDGRPIHHVTRFQMMAPSSAQSAVVMLMTFVSTIPFPIVEATAVPIRAPVRLKKAASAIACRGVSTFVETTVAIAFAASWKPLMYSNAMAASTTMMNRTMWRASNGAYEYLSTTWRMMFPASRQRSITFSRSS